MRASKILNIAKANSTRAAHRKRPGWETPIPIANPNSHKHPSAVDGSSAPYTRRIKKYDGKESGKRSRFDESTFSVSAEAITGKSCQNKNTGQRIIAIHFTFPKETKYTQRAQSSKEPPSPATPNPRNINPRATTSRRPLIVR